LRRTLTPYTIRTVRPSVVPFITSVTCSLLSCSQSDDLIASYRGSSAAGASGGTGQAGEGAGGAGAPPCVPDDPVAVDAIAQYRFEDDPGSVEIADSAGALSAAVTGGPSAFVPGPDGCGSAFFFGDGTTQIVVPDSPLWDLDSGSIAFWFRVPDAPLGPYGLLSRDQNGTDQPGHHAYWLAADGTVVTRLQAEPMHATRCSAEPLGAGQWVHVGFNFGPPGTELFVDGRLASRLGAPGVPTIVPDCGADTPGGIAGNDLPWRLGYDSTRADASGAGVLYHFSNGAIDELVISRTRRNFAAP